MDNQHRAIRAHISSMAPRRAEAYIRSFELPEEEAESLIQCDVRCLSYIQAAERLHISSETLKKRRRRAFAKIADEILNP